MMSSRTFAPALALAICLPVAAGAATAPVHVRGTVASISPSSITVTTATGPVAIAVASKTKFAGALPASTDDIKTGTFIGTANVASGGTARALEVVVFPSSMRGTGEGDYPWDLSAKHASMTNGTVALHKGSSMTNATVNHISSGAVKTVSVSYKGGTKTIAIPPNAPIVRVEPGSAKLLATGAHVFVVAIPTGGKLGAAFVVVGENGTVPPM